MVAGTASRPVEKAKFRHLYPFRSNYLTINGLRYHYLDEGSGEPLICVHGNPTWSFYFRKLVLGLRNRYRVIVPDHMGCGLSEKPDTSRYGFRLQNRVDDLSALMDHLMPHRPVTLVLHDWGGMIGLAWALARKQMVARIVITNTAGFFPPQNKPLPWQLRLIRANHPLMNRLVLQTNLFARSAVYLAAQRKLQSDVRAGLLAPYNTPHNRLATLKFVHDIPLTPLDPSGGIVSDVEQQLSSFAGRPAMILWGARDFVFDRDYFKAWRRRLPHAETHWFKEAGHYLMEDESRAVVSRIEAFLHRHPAE